MKRNWATAKCGGWKFLLTSLVVALANPAAESGPLPISAKSAVQEADSGHAAQTNQEPSEGKRPARPENHLAGETSPYLLMHVNNPVDWYPWSEEALQLARDQNKPIFLSIGYSSCHWCHVMEEESFMDEEIAKFLNEHFVCIKVDREERPDIDTIYMEALHVINQLTRSGRGGGWPLSAFLTPEGKPFFAGTYFPARDGDRGAPVGFLTVIKKIHEAWSQRPDRVQRDADLITDLTRKSLAGKEAAADAELKPLWLTVAMKNLSDSFDPVYGGFGFSAADPDRPKFPEPSNLLFLADRIDHDPDDAVARKMLTLTCQRMAMGGIHDHIGGGFHRYSVDRYWRIPHFEKMLYDNGQLASVYSEAFRLIGDESFRWAVEDLLAFVDREMTDSSGGFYSALDADSEGEEGKFYRWKRDEIRQALTDEEYKLFAPIYGIDQAPNFEGQYYVPQLSQPLEEWASRLKMQPAQLQERLGPIRQKLLKRRTQRQRPLTDHKILASWNGMMIRGYADAGRVFEKGAWIATAERAAEFVLNRMVDERGRIYRTVTDGRPKLNGYLDDYACVIDGLLALHRATGDEKWLRQGMKLQKKQDELFWDDEHGGYFFTADDHEQLIARTKRFIDSAVPSGNSVSVGNLVYLASATGEDHYRQRAHELLKSAAPVLDQFPHAAPRMLMHLREFVSQ